MSSGEKSLRFEITGEFVQMCGIQPSAQPHRSGFNAKGRAGFRGRKMRKTAADGFVKRLLKPLSGSMHDLPKVALHICIQCNGGPH